MTTLLHKDDATVMLCEKGHSFYVSPCGEENMEWDESVGLYAVCPECGEREIDERLA